MKSADRPTDALRGYFPRVLPAVVMSLVLGAHFTRWGEPGLVVAALLAPLLLIFRQRWTLLVYQVLLFAGTVRWVEVAVELVVRRNAEGIPSTRAGALLVSVALLTLVAALLLHTKPVMYRHCKGISTAWASVVSFIAVVVLSSFPHIKLVSTRPLIAERLLPGSGWVEVVLLGLYAGWLSEHLITSKSTSKIRSTVWTLFSVVFFLQLAAGVSGFSEFLLTGKLHIPLPAMIIAGPIYRGALSLFMPVLLITTIIIAGPAWCSWFCYFGSWDFIASKRAPAGRLNVRNSVITRTVMLLILTAGALVLRWNRLPGTLTIAIGLLLVLVSVGVMVTASMKTGVMHHCTGFCPVGLITTTIGKINPFRIKIGNRCTSCHACIKSCRYGALTENDIHRKKPGFTCTLCGDCVAKCSSQQIAYRFPGLSPEAAKRLFLVIVVVVHTLFLGFGRM